MTIRKHSTAVRCDRSQSANLWEAAEAFIDSSFKENLREYLPPKAFNGEKAISLRRGSLRHTVILS